jgi:hypothetical protein
MQRQSKFCAFCAFVVNIWWRVQERIACQGDQLGDEIFKNLKASFKLHFTADTPCFFVCVFLAFNPVRQNSDLKIITICCLTLYKVYRSLPRT